MIVTPTIFSLKWNKRFMARAREVAAHSKDPIVKVGAVIIGSEKELITDGFNGYPRGFNEKGNVFSDREYVKQNIVHAEANALMNALRTGARVKNGILYTTRIPCSGCLGLIKQSGIVAVVVDAPDDAYWEEEDHDQEEIYRRFIDNRMPLYFLSAELRKVV